VAPWAAAYASGDGRARASQWTTAYASGDGRTTGRGAAGRRRTGRRGHGERRAGDGASSRCGKKERDVVSLTYGTHIKSKLADLYCYYSTHLSRLFSFNIHKTKFSTIISELLKLDPFLRPVRIRWSPRHPSHDVCYRWPRTRAPWVMDVKPHFRRTPNFQPRPYHRSTSLSRSPLRLLSPMLSLRLPECRRSRSPSRPRTLTSTTVDWGPTTVRQAVAAPPPPTRLSSLSILRRRGRVSV
jgi:hypothetical protein